MTDETEAVPLPSDELRDEITALMQTVTTLLEEEATLETLKTALHSHDVLSDQLAAHAIDAPTQDSLARIEQFILLQAGHYYQTTSAKLSERQNNHFIALFARQLLAFEGIGPVTARKLFELGIATPEQFFALSPEAITNLPLPPATQARLIVLHAKASH